MVDLNSSPPTPPAPPIGERLKIKNFMGRAPAIGALKSKFLTVLGNSNELLNGISNKLAWQWLDPAFGQCQAQVVAGAQIFKDMLKHMLSLQLALSISSSDSDYCINDEEEELKLLKYDETIDYTKIDFESRRVKARRAHEEIMSGRFRHPNLAPRPRLETFSHKASNKIKRSSSSASSSSSCSSSSTSLHSVATNAVERSRVSSPTRSNSLESRHSGGYGRPGRAIAGARRSELDVQKDLLRVNGKTRIPSPHSEAQLHTVEWTEHTEAQRHHIRVPVHSRTSNSSTLTSLRDDPELQISPSMESSDWKHLFIRSESQNSVPSWASSISLDCHASEEPIKQFMKRFTELLFSNTSALTVELKSEFGSMARLDTGRQWFTRFLVGQRVKTKRVDELTFHSLIQYFGLVLFECGECEDYKPATVIMNLCFVFYHEIEVPGCDAYREYLFSFMRQQPIWQNLRFWNAAFVDAVQSEREHRLALKAKHAENHEKHKKHTTQEQPKIMQEEAVSSHSSSSSSKRQPAPEAKKELSKEPQTTSEARMQDNIIFRQLGAFTCNMHALGIPQPLCLEFFNKQVTNLNLSHDKMKSIKDNVTRMYHETEMWGAKES